jgi:hypothetical protein
MLDFENDIAKIGGWLTETEGIFLYKTAKKVRQQNIIVEIGSWKGKSTICLGKGVKDGNKTQIYAIDPHIGLSENQKMFGGVDIFLEFTKNIKNTEVEQYIQPIKQASKNASKNFSKLIEFIFIDGAHEFRFVCLDFKLWFPKVVDGGIIAFHDTWRLLGPNLVTAKILLTSSKVRNPRLIDTITCFEKVKKNSFFDRIKNINFLFYRTLFGIVGFLKLKYKGTVLK